MKLIASERIRRTAAPRTRLARMRSGLPAIKLAAISLALLSIFLTAAAHAQIATTITLTVSNPNPVYATPSAPGAAAPLTPTLITATVTETSSGKPVTGGTVTFYDQPPLDRTVAADPLGTASILGTPTFTPAGQSQLFVSLGAGVHTLTAIYSGTAGNASAGVPHWATSTTAGPLSVTVTGQAQSTPVINFVGADGSFLAYDPNQPIVSGDLFVYGYGMQYPPGTASIFDNTTSTLYPQPAGTSLQELYSSLGQTINLNTPAPGVTSFILADPFRAGVPSIVAFYSNLNAIYTIDINRAQATSIAAATATGCSPCNVAASPTQGVAFDMNNDGLLDIVVAHKDTTSSGIGVGILYNTLNPDPTVTSPQHTFNSPEVTYKLGHPISYVAVGDVNGDGKPDIVALTADNTNLIIVVTNNGDGTFTQQPATFATGNGPTQIALADINNDGNLDLVTLNSLDDTIGVLLGNGDGSFQTMLTTAASPAGYAAIPQAFAIGHLGNNHVPTPNLSIAVVSQYNYTLNIGTGYVGGAVLIGAGDGTFTPRFYNFGFGDFGEVASATFTAQVSQIQAADIDGDGIPDLIYSYPQADSFFPLVYDVPGDFYPFEDGYTGSGATSTPVGNFQSVGVGIGDINGDGINDIVLMNPDNSTLYPGNPTKNAITIFLNTLYSQDQIPALITAPGSHSLTASYAPATGSIYAPVTTPPVVVNIPLPGIASFSSNPINFGSVPVGSTATQTLTITDTGTGPLKIPYDFITNAAYGYQTTTDTCAGATLQPTNTCTITLTFTPVATGFVSGTLSITDTQVGSPQAIPLNGTGTSTSTGSNTGTTIVLTSSNTTPNYITPATGGLGTSLNPVTLTATVTVTATGVPVVGGSVTFYDTPGDAPIVGTSVIGTANIQFPAGGDGVPNGIATLPFAFGPGPHTLTATYSGTTVGPPAAYNYAPSATTSPVNLTSTGYAAEAYGFQLEGLFGTIAYYNPQSSLTQLNYNFNQDPTESDPFLYGYGMQVPTGTATVTDQTTGITYPMFGSDYADTVYNLYAPQLTVVDIGGYVYGNYVYSLGAIGVTNFFTADVFQSGVPALITLSSTNNQVITSNLYSNPNSYAGCNGYTGTSPTCAVATPPVQGLASDVNGDGRLDLIIAHNDPSGNASVGVFLNTLNLATCGSNCGAFNNPEITYGTGHPTGNVAVGDVNGDGVPDIVATSSDGSNLISVLINNGDGTFALSPTTFATGNGVSQLSLGDFNADGVLDIAILNKADQTIGILTGNGDGSFNAMVPYTVGTNPTSFSMADLNLDGFLDFAITNNDSPTQAEVSFLYGAAGGAFNYVADLSLNQLYLAGGAGFNYPETNPMPTVITATDLNGDGYPDLFIGFNINQYTYALWNSAKNMYVYAQTAYYDQPDGINFRTNSMPVVDLDGDGLKDQLYMTAINNNIVCSGCSPSNNNLMVRTNGAFVYGWSGPDVIDSPTGNHTFNAAYTPPANSIYQPATAGPITIPIVAEPIITLSPSTVDFGFVQVGTTSPPVNVIVQNTGNASAVDLAYIISYEYPADAGFNVSPGTCGTSLPGGGATCTLSVTFSPGSVVGYVGYLAATYTGGSVETFLTGQGTNNPIGYVNVGETIHLTDTVTAATAHPISVAETIVLTDTVSAATAHPIVVAETIHLTDTVSAATPHLVAVSETIHLTDTVSALLPVIINDIEAIHVTDTDSTQLSIAINDLEAIHVTDTDSTLLSILINDPEAIHVTDTDAVNVATSYTDTVKLTPSATLIPPGGSVLLTATVTPSVSPSQLSGTVNFYDGSSFLGSSSLASGTASYTATALSPGTHLLSAQYLGNTYFPPGTSPSVSVTVTSQNILTVTPASFSRNFGLANPALTYNVTGFVNGDTSAVLSGSATLSTSATINSPAGAYLVTAAPGTLSAPSNYVFSFATGTLTINGGALQVITFYIIPPTPLATHQLVLSAHSSSGALGQPVTYTVTGPATLSGNTLTFTGTGTVSVTASQAANTTFAAAASVTRSFLVTP